MEAGKRKQQIAEMWNINFSTWWTVDQTACHTSTKGNIS